MSRGTSGACESLTVGMITLTHKASLRMLIIQDYF